ncbi:hypothetical protein ACFXOL_21035 [Streptomyces californicus]|uniref:hypothetical protein n=1 Tax=Streptomyces californicus TaxID=67351 RepID=UPI00364AA381
MEIAFTEQYRTQQELDIAYRRLNHQAKPAPTWGATLLIHLDLSLSWGCHLIDPLTPADERPRIGWHIIAGAGELAYPPLRPEEDIWPALLAQHPVPTTDAAAREAEFRGCTVEEMHREKLRYLYLGSATIGTGSGLKRNPTDVNFDPIVRDWDVTARELAEFLDTHKPPKLTAEQRVMAQGAELVRLEEAVRDTRTSLAHLMRNARRAQGPKPRHGFKADLARWTARSRPTVDAWLADSDAGDSGTPDEDPHHL